MTLATCPFCGGTPTPEAERGFHRLSCCNLECPIHPQTLWRKTRTAAAKDWNTRSKAGLLRVLGGVE
jgi:hypothetical protein